MALFSTYRRGQRHSSQKGSGPENGPMHSAVSAEWTNQSFGQCQSLHSQQAGHFEIEKRALATAFSRHASAACMPSPRGETPGLFQTADAFSLTGSQHVLASVSSGIDFPARPHRAIVTFVSSDSTSEWKLKCGRKLSPQESPHRSM
jgi:hypothetical protein